MSARPAAIFTPRGISSQCAEMSKVMTSAEISTAPTKEMMTRNLFPSILQTEVRNYLVPLFGTDKPGRMDFFDVFGFHVHGC